MKCPNCGYEFNLVNEYLIKSEPVSTIQDGIKKAVPVVSEYRERFKSKTLRQQDITAQKASPKLVDLDGQLNNFKYKGENLFFGDGIQMEY